MRDFVVFSVYGEASGNCVAVGVLEVSIGDALWVIDMCVQEVLQSG